MRVNRRLIIVSLLGITGMAGISSCAVLSPTTKTTSYNEDLTMHRPKVEYVDSTKVTPTQEKRDIRPTHDQTAAIDKKINGITSKNAASKTAQGFTIQVYSGTSREEASQAKAKVYKILPDSRPETKYEQPIYRVRVGEFGDRLQAQNVYAELAEEFPGAIVIPSRIRLN